MAFPRIEPNSTKYMLRNRVLENQGKQPRIKEQQPVCNSPRQQAVQQICEQSTIKSQPSHKIQALPLTRGASKVAIGKEASQCSQVLHIPSKPYQTRKRGREVEHISPRGQDRPPSKRPRISPPNCTVEERAATDIGGTITSSLLCWIQNGRWPEEYFRRDSQVEGHFERAKYPEELEQRNWYRENCSKEQFRPMHGFHHLQHLFARKKSSSSIRRKTSEASLRTPSDQLPRDIKSAQYRTVEYENGLEKKGSYMCKSNEGCKKESLERLSWSKQTVPHDSLFRDDLFDKTCEKLRNRNEAMIIQDITRLIVPSAQNLAIYGASNLDHLYECVNEGWNSAIPFHGTRPQPDYSVGFGRSAFTEERLGKLEPFVGDIVYGSGLTSLFMATTRMYFPFLTCEVKCGASALDVADRQNAQSMTIAVRGVVELYKAVKREKELDREILAFSISHDHSAVRIYGHYAAIKDEKTTFYRHPIKKYDFTSEEGKDKWTAYKFIKSVYDIWVPVQHQRICSALDELPGDVDFNLSHSASFPTSGVQSSQQSNVEDDGHSSFMGSQEMTPTTSFSQATERASKKQNNQRTTK